jgi:hypothetical protein
MIHQIVSHKFIVLCLSILVALPFLIQLPEVKTVDNVDYFAIKNDPDIIFYDKLKTIFGNDEFFIVAFKKENLFTAELLGLLKKLTNELAGIEGVREIKSLSNANDIVGEENFFIVRQFLETIPEDSQSLEKLRKRAVENPLYLKNILSSDGNTAAILISVHRKPNEPDFRGKIITQAETILGKYKDKTGAVHIAGWTFTNLALSQYLKKDIVTFVPITFVFISLSVFLFFGNIRLTMISIVHISLCVGCTMGLLPMLGMTLNSVTIIAPPVVMALALSDMAHIFSCLDDNLIKQYPDKEQAFAEVLGKLAAPCFLTTLTTAVGFFSLYLNDSPPIKEFAIITSAGIVFEFVFSFTFMPAFMLLFDEKKFITSIYRFKTGSSNMSRYLSLLSKFNLNCFRWISLTGLLITSLSVWLSFQIRVESNLLEYFKPKSPVRISSGFVEKELGGVGTLDISFKADSGEAFKQPENLLMIETLQKNINTIEGVDKTLSFVDYVKNMNRSFHSERPEFYRIPDSTDLISQYLLLYDPDDIRNFINESFDHARMSIRISKHSTRDQAVMIKQIHAFVKAMNTQGMDIQVSGQVLQEVNTIAALIKGQIYSLATSVIIIFLIMFFALRSLPLSLLSIFSNLFPIAVNFGIMGLFNIPINESTALISSLIMGIAVDDTIHFLTKLKRILTGSADTRQAITQTLQERGKGMILSSLILFIGFGVMIFSNFVPTMYFGLLSSLMILWALMGDVLLLPATIMVVSTMTRIKLHK